MARVGKHVLVLVAFTFAVQVAQTCLIDGRKWSFNIASGGVEFFTEEIFLGYSFVEDYTPGCHEIPVFFQKKVQSVKLNGKLIKVFNRRGCGGSSVVLGMVGSDCSPIFEGNAMYCKYMLRLKENGWNKRILSWMPAKDQNGKLQLGLVNSFNTSRRFPNVNDEYSTETEE